MKVVLKFKRNTRVLVQHHDATTTLSCWILES